MNTDRPYNLTFSAPTGHFTGALIRVILKYDGNKMEFPCAPSSLPISRPTRIHKYDVVGLGQVSLANDPDLRTITLESIFWNEVIQMRGNDKTVDQYHQFLMDWADSKEVGEISFIDEDEDSSWVGFNMKCLCTNYDNEVRPNEEEDKYFTLSIVEVRERLEQVDAVDEESAIGEYVSDSSGYYGYGGDGGDSGEARERRTHIVRRGDNNYNIARKFGMPGYRWSDLAEIPENAALFNANIHRAPNWRFGYLIHPYQELILPESWFD